MKKNNNKIVILFPGALKPFHDGHLSIINSYINNLDNKKINEIKIIISQKERDGITASSTYNFLLKLFKEKYKNVLISIEIADNVSPIAVCYGIVSNDENNNIYCLASSSKDKKDDRTNYFKNYFIKNNQENKVIDLNVNRKPLFYKNRSDKFNNKPISSSIVRYDINNYDFNNFITSYQNILNEKLISKDDLFKYFNILKSELIYDINNKKIKELLNENFEKNKYNKYNNKIKHIINMRKNVEKDIEKTCINVSKIAEDYDDIDFNQLADDLEDAGISVSGKHDPDTNDVIMEIDSDDLDDAIDMMESDPYNIDDANSYICGDSSDEEIDIEDDEDDDYDEDEDDEVDIEDEDEDYDEDDEDDEDEEDEEDYDEDEDYDYDEDDEDDDYDEDDEDDDYDLDDEDDDEEDYSQKNKKSFSHRNRKRQMLERRKLNFLRSKNHRILNENFKRKRKHCNCSLFESVKKQKNEEKYIEPKNKKKLEISVRKLQNIIDDLKNKDNFDEKIGMKAINKLKKEYKKAKAADLSFKFKSLDGAKQIFKKLLKMDPSVKELDEKLSIKMIMAFNNHKPYLYENVNVNNRPLKRMNLRGIINLLKETRTSKLNLETQYRKTLNEGNSFNGSALKNILVNKIKLIKILKEELEYRQFINSSRNFRLLKEADEEDNKEENKDDNKDLTSSFGDTSLDSSTNDLSNDTTSDDTDEEVELSKIVFTMKNKDAADEFIKVCVDNGIPEDALEIQDDKTNESFRLPKHLRALLEDDETDLDEKDEDKDDKDEKDEDKDDKDDKDEKDDEDKEEDDKKDEDADKDKPVKVCLTDTDYTEKMSEILNDVYGISKDEFEEKLGGEIISDDKSSDEDKDTEDKDTEDKSSDEDKNPDDEEINPEDVFNFENVDDTQK